MKNQIAGIFCFLAGVLSVNLLAPQDAEAQSDPVCVGDQYVNYSGTVHAECAPCADSNGNRSPFCITNEAACLAELSPFDDTRLNVWRDGECRPRPVSLEHPPQVVDLISPNYYCDILTHRDSRTGEPCGDIEFIEVCQPGSGQITVVYAHSHECECPEGQAYHRASAKCVEAEPVAAYEGCPEGQIDYGDHPERPDCRPRLPLCTDGSDGEDGTCSPPPVSLFGYVEDGYVCSDGQIASGGHCPDPLRKPEISPFCDVGELWDPNRGEYGECYIPESSILTRTPEDVQSGPGAVQEAAAQLGIAQASYAPVQQISPSNESRLPEYAAPAALLGALAFSSLYPDYNLNSSFNYSGENGSLDWEAGMRGDFHHGSFRSYVSAVQSESGFEIESGTTYRSDSFLASYTTVEAKDYMNYAVQLSAPWSRNRWSISPNLSSEFHYDRDENHSSSDSGAGLDLEYRF